MNNPISKNIHFDNQILIFFFLSFVHIYILFIHPFFLPSLCDRFLVNIVFFFFFLFTEIDNNDKIKFFFQFFFVVVVVCLPSLFQSKIDLIWIMNYRNKQNKQKSFAVNHHHHHNHMKSNSIIKRKTKLQGSKYILQKESEYMFSIESFHLIILVNYYYYTCTLFKHLN